MKDRPKPKESGMPSYAENMIKFQHQLRHNSTDVSNYVGDLNAFKSEMDKKEKAKKVEKPKAAPQKKKLPPIRNKVDISESWGMTQPKNKSTPQVDKETEKKLKGYRRDNTAMPDYYKAWDKLAANIDEESDDEVEAAKNPVKEKDKEFS